jgi:alcohol dehydrogenase (cytochrome c)
VIWSSSVTRPASSATYDAGTGDLLWQFATGSGIRGGPITYTVNNKQYVAVPSGWRGWLKGFAPGLYAVREA